MLRGCLPSFPGRRRWRPEPYGISKPASKSAGKSIAEPTRFSNGSARTFLS